MNLTLLLNLYKHFQFILIIERNTICIRKPICGYDIVNYDYVSFIIIQKHTDGYVIKIITSSQNTSSSDNYYDVFDFKLQGGNANIWYI